MTPQLIFPPEMRHYLQQNCGYSVPQIDSLDISLQQTPLCTYIRVNTHRISLQECQERVQDAIRRQCQQKQWLADQFKVEPHPWIKDLLVVPVRRHFLPAQTPLAVLVDCNCGSAILRGADIFAAGILSCSPSIQPGDRVSVYVDVDRSCLYGQFPDTLLRSNSKSVRFIGNGIARMSRDAIFKGTGGQPPRGIAISMTETEYRTPSLSSALPGLAILQNLPSVLVGHLLSPRPGDCVLDMCAAPGGKTTHLAALMGNQGTLLALDRSQKRAGRVAELCAQFQLDCVRVKAGDSSKLCQSDYEFWQPDDSFDRILLDPSCSGIGQRPLFQWDPSITADNLSEFGSYQRHLFRVAFRLLKPGGRLVYSTCTLNIDENESVVKWAMGELDGIELLDARQLLHQDTTQLQLGVFGDGRVLAEPFQQRVIKFDPTVCTETVGFFCAAFTKTTLVI